MPVRNNWYRCDNRFHVDQVQDLYSEHHAIGVIIVSGETTQMYKCVGTSHALLDEINVHRQKHQRKGGQSAPRFQRIREGQIHEYIKTIQEHAWRVFARDGKCIVHALVISGAADIRDQLLTTGSFALTTLITPIVCKGATVTDALMESGAAKTLITTAADKKLAELFERLAIDDPTIIYGRDEITSAYVEKMTKCVYVCAGDPLLDVISDAVIVPLDSMFASKLSSYGSAIAERWY